MVLLGTRDPGRGQAEAERLRAEDLDVHALQLEVTDAGSETATAIGADCDRLDILVNNAGINDAGDGPPTSASIDAVRRVLETNFIGALAVTQARLPLLRRSPSARIVNMSSSLGSLTLNGDPTSDYYAVRLIGDNASKASLNMLTVQLTEQLRDSPILVNAACPGFAKTDLNGNAGHLSVPEAAATPVRLALLRRNQPAGMFLNTDGALPW
jgi:NAD(P)-dependent dehydrogenase (short-subunit alcohol dehydrogenase family)